MTAALIEEARRLTWPHDTPHDAERAKVIEALCDALEAAEQERDAAKAEVERLKRERDAMLEAAKAFQDLNGVYRMGGRPSEKLFQRLDCARETMRAAVSPPAPEPKR